MNTPRRSERDLNWAIAAVLMIAVLALVFAAVRLKQRQLALTDINLERNHQLLHGRIDMLVQQVDRELMEKAESMVDRPISDTLALRRMWDPLFAADPAIVVARVADAEGNEMALVRSPQARTRFTFHRAQRNALPAGLSITGDTTLYLEGHSDGDPRMSLWYSKALEDSRGTPVWNLRPAAIGSPSILQVAHMVRVHDGPQPFQVMALELDLSRSTALDTRITSAGRTAIMVHDGNGRRIEIPAISDQAGPIAQAAKQALDQWTGNRTREAYTVQVGDRLFRASSQPILLNGEMLHGLAVIDVALVTVWTDTERNALVFAVVLLVMLISLFVWSWVRRIDEARQMARQARLSQTQEKRLAKALGEREVLNREVHHRVKNNLQVVSSLLNLQMARMDDEGVRTEFLRGKRRIDTIALVHHKLYGLKDLRNVDLQLFFKGLIDATKATYVPMSERVSCELDTGGLRVDQDTAIELGIILCELLGNAMQHAFPYATGGHVDIVVQPVEGDLYRLLVKDNGRGMAENAQDGPGKLGLEIVEALAEQLDGSFHRRSNGGTVCEVTFRMRQERPLPIAPEA